MRFKLILMSFLSLLLVGFLAACGSNDEDQADENAANDTEETEGAEDTEEDVVTTASLVNEPDAFVNAVSEDGTWIIAALDDIAIDEDVVVAGEFYDKDDESGDIYRKIAPYTQDEDHNITDSFTITVPSLTVQSENLNFQGGTLQGDVIVEANGFMLDETATIDGNLKFANEEAESSATIDGEVTGEIE
ncbi:hypothetical protein [Oceanobacillus neutriphilus]|uniref:Polymer-forming cytoskeletal protein n=1 Tax=Oceanobacillus neutriphilus TaxID=531815 RepID=A0ABQ2NR56_9BACI|nr:hypothetical protein [Oceanobacillus neutriphilus]GGP08392.1 hypothetical protein GCM10011346_08250 [Oceanobacillus neutriphilus]